ncbi:HSP20-like chaperone [Gigaspora margarita]|uniref:HSP20-like chaperone n=1 Tax=Gigaspora margarita TaxID=4874 RepID=A0A8H4AXR5_GIGMA|nr:HSP20-like chaperone [Gigaspora margarita]
MENIVLVPGDFNDVKRFGSVQRSNRGFRIQPLDVHEGDKEFVVNAELPGVTKEQINLDVRDGSLYISGDTKQDEKYKEGNTHIQDVVTVHFLVLLLFLEMLKRRESVLSLKMEFLK